MRIIDKVVKLLETKKEMTLSEFYEAMPEHSKASIRGNINRYIKKDDCRIERCDRAVYRIVEVLSQTKEHISYMATYYNNETELVSYYKKYNNDISIPAGIYTKEFDGVDKMLEDETSLQAILAKGDVRDILPRIDSESMNLICTDVPYPVISGGSGSKGAPSGMLSKNDGKIFTHNDIRFDEYFGELYRILRNDSQAYFFTNFINLQKMMDELQRAGFKLHNLLVWEKQNATPNRWYMKNCEYVIFARKGKAKSITNAGSKTVHQFDNLIGNKIHETEKPIDLLRMYIRNRTNKGDWVFDPFSGSASTLIAGLCENRKVFGCEIDSTYYTKGKERLKAYFKNGYDFRETELCNSSFETTTTAKQLSLF